MICKCDFSKKEGVIALFLCLIMMRIAGIAVVMARWTIVALVVVTVIMARTVIAAAAVMAWAVVVTTGLGGLSVHGASVAQMT